MIRRGIPTFWILLGLFTIFFTGVGLLVWLAPVPEAQLTPAQDSLIAISDWMVKAAIGAILGFAGGVGLAGRNGRGG